MIIKSLNIKFNNLFSRISCPLNVKSIIHSAVQKQYYFVKTLTQAVPTKDYKDGIVQVDQASLKQQQK